MRRTTISIALFGGILCLTCAILLLRTSTNILAQDDEREYAGARECSDCHRDIRNQHRLTRHGMTLLEVEEDAEPEDLEFVLGDFSIGEDVRTLTFPAQEARAFTLEDVAFTLGAGKHYQAYVTILEEDVYSVLPAQWDVNAGAWVPLELAETWPDEAYNFGSQCAGCHTVGLTVDADNAGYAWEEEGVQCEACHGPGSLHIDLVDDAGREITGDEYLEISAALDDPTDAQVCGACHSRGQTVDGSHPYPLSYSHGDALNDSYTLFPPEDTTHWYANGYASSSNMQYNEWQFSGHATSLNTVLGSSAGETACLMCHSASYRFAQQALSSIDNTTSEAFTTAPLLLRMLQDSGLPPSKQQMMIARWLPLALDAMQSEQSPQTPLEDVLFPLLDLLDIDDDDYDPEAPLLMQFMPQLAEYILDAEEEAIEDNDTENRDTINALMAQLVPLLVNEIEAQRLPVADAIGSELVDAADHFGVTCVTCHAPHPNEDAPPPAAVSMYALCTSCHRNTTLTETLHHPVKEMFEGQQIVAGIEGTPATHFEQQDGPRCVTCHMSEIPLLNQQSTRFNHTWRPVLPNADPESPPDACSNCHEALSTNDLRSLIEDTQASVQSRMALAWSRVGTIEEPEPDTEAAMLYRQAVDILLFIQNDGSMGVHNYAYVDALLNTASEWLSQLSVPGSNLKPTEAPAPTATLSADAAVTAHEVLSVTSGMRPITLIILLGSSLILIVGAFMIFRQSSRSSSGREI